MEDPELPSYSPTSAIRQTEHSCSLENSGKKWLSLVVRSRASSPSSLPVFLEGDVISGSVELNLDKPETVKAITIAARAGTTAVGQEEYVFLEIKQTLWVPHEEGGKVSSKLSGHHSWPFELVLPSEVLASEMKGKGERLYKLPPIFTERASPAYIDYRIVVTVKRRALKVNDTLSTIFGYQPITVPDPPSTLRQLAYEKKQPFPGPDVDPEGWKLLPPVQFEGTIFGAKHVNMECTLAIATPLCYAVGSPLPLRLTLTSQDTQALEVLSTPAAIRLHLVRSMSIGFNAANENETKRTDNYFLEGVGQAFFWASGEESSNRRVLEGELEVARTLKPSFVFPRFTIQYHLELLPFQAPGFVPLDTQVGAVLISEKVIVTTKQTPGVAPRSYAPPGYERPPKVNYNNSVGFLENGNQRFWHHGR